ncbi:molybdate transport system ATP-binding protein [Agromyces hippuratus]|uniref:Molybdate transport system ATP-binding protein n=1 Tax=Agromyces hippuratus TaxID=286438 RepID=A0A852WS39_9MICO|nr:ATP-binding cassette domain-containing protein [Agromyces hippuratus]NYG20736.1 molybdate transport system ATP-binding protein [Agromyces hippuratus]
MSGGAASEGLVADVTTRRGDFALDVSLHVAPGETLAVLGPNGSGKTTLLQTIAGTLAVDRGAVHLAGRELGSAEPGRPRRHVGPEGRRVGLLGQQPLLFPHLSALDNVAFGPRAQGVGSTASRETARRWLARVGLAELASRRPLALSGGQRQRVALARTLAARPEVLLLDEPFTALDVESGPEMRALIAEHPWPVPIPILLVTHDPLDAIVLADRAAILHDGRIVQQGATAEVLGHPASPFVAALAGVNLVIGVIDADGDIVSGAASTGTASAASTGAGPVLRAAGAPPAPGTRVAAVFGPGAVHVAPTVPGEPAASVNSWTGTVAVLQPVPGGVRIGIAEHPRLFVDVPSAAAVSLDLSTGARLGFTIPATEVSVRALPAAVLR